MSTATGPVFSDPNAIVALFGSLAPEIATDISLTTVVGPGSESIQMKFQGEGWIAE